MERVLIVSASSSAAARLGAWLGDETHCDVCPDAEAAGLLLETQAFDWIVVNASAPGGDMKLPVSPGVPVLLLLAKDAYEVRVAQLAAKGIFALPKPLSPALFSQAAWLLRAASRQTRRLQGRLETVRSMERAKWLLMQTLQMDEGQAHRYIEKQAMNQRRTKREVAEDIIKTYEN